jgi:hypothetical protein
MVFEVVEHATIPPARNLAGAHVVVHRARAVKHSKKHTPNGAVPS